MGLSLRTRSFARCGLEFWVSLCIFGGIVSSKVWGKLVAVDEDTSECRFLQQWVRIFVKIRGWNFPSFFASGGWFHWLRDLAMVGDSLKERGATLAALQRKGGRG